MKKLFICNSSEKGFILPYSAVLSSLVLLAILSLIAIYENELVMTERLTEQIHVESIVQMVEVDIRDELISNNWGTIEQEVFNYPYGWVEIKEVTVNDGDDIAVRVTVNTDSYSYPNHFLFIRD